MKVLVMASQKGGVGKTTIAAHVAVAAAAAGIGPVVVVDTDPQASLADWWNAREHSDAPAFLADVNITTLPDQLAQLREAGAALAIIDTPPAKTNDIARVVALADLVLILTLPSPIDLRAIGHTLGLVQDSGSPFVFCINRCKPNVYTTQEVYAELIKHGDVCPLLWDRADFATAFATGHTLQERTPKSKGAQEVAALWTFIRRRLSIPSIEEAKSA